MHERANINRSDARLVTVFFTLVFAAYTLVFPYISVVNNPNENVRTYMTMAIVEQHTLRIDDIVGRHGWVNDMARAPEAKMSATDAATFCALHPAKCHLYSVKAPGVSYLGVPVYWVMTRLAHPPTVASSLEQRTAWLRNSNWALRLFSVQLPCFAFLIAFERLLRRVSGDVVLRLSAVAAVGLGTNYLAYALMFASHSLFAVAAFASFALTTGERLRFADARRRRVWRAMWAGVFAGLATLLEYHALPVSAALALYALTTFYRPTRLVMFALGGLANVGALMFFQWRAFGDPLMPGHKMSENPAYAQLLSQGLFGIGTPSWEVARDITLSRSYGLLGTSSFMWLGLLGLPLPLLLLRGRGRHGARIDGVYMLASAFASLAMLLLWLTVSAAINWRGGWTVGPRYLGAAPPFFAAGALLALESWSGRAEFRRTVARAAATGLALASVAQSGLVSTLYNTIPESVTRPLPQLVMPYMRLAFVPHHLFELLGVDSPNVYFAVVWSMVSAVIIVLVWRMDRERIGPYFRRIVLACVFVAAGIAPAFSEPTTEDGGDGGLTARRDLTAAWEPQGRDRIARLRVQAERYGSRAPCAWLKLAEMDRLLSNDAQAVADEARAGTVAAGVCK